MRFVISLASVLVGFFMEWLAFQYLNQKFGYALLIHHMASLITMISIHFFLRKRFASFFSYFYLLIYSFSFLIPILGMVLSILTAYLIYQRNTSVFKYAETVDTDINLDEFKSIIPKYGAGGVMKSLFNKKLSPFERTKALFILSQHSLANVNPYIKKLLPDESDEMRLLAFNILDEEESQLSYKIQKLEKEKYNGDKKTTKELARLYWELVFNHLILPELETKILEKSFHYAQEALKSLPDDASLWELLGKIHNKLQHYDEAEAAFDRALELNIPPSRVLPYLAEIKFLQKKYSQIPQYLNASESLSDIDATYLVKKFWCGEGKDANLPQS